MMGLTYANTASDVSRESALKLLHLIQDFFSGLKSSKETADALTQLTTAGLALNRIIRAYGTGPAKETSQAALDESDKEWISWVLENVGEKTLPLIGWHAAGTALEGVINRLKVDQQSALEKLERGMVDKMLSGSGEDRRAGDLTTPKIMKELLTAASFEFVHVTQTRSTTRFERHRFLGVSILCEASELQRRAGSKTISKTSRKLAEEYAIMRAFGVIGSVATELADITRFWDAMGGIARLDSSISNALDRVEDYATRVGADEDLIEAGRAAGRPFMQDIKSIRKSVQQSRRFRDRERSLKTC